MDFDNKKTVAGVVGLLIVAAAGMWVFQMDDPVDNSEAPVENGEDTPETSEPSDSSGTEYSVECPDEVVGHCRDLSQKHNGDVAYQYKAQYTGRNGSAYYVQLESDSPVEDTGNSTVVIKFDGESGRVWDIQ
jgi:hypothetical protein